MSGPSMIQINGCKSCGYSGHKMGQLVCQAHPPVAAPVFSTNDKGQMIPTGWCSSFPPVAPELKCGEWKVRIALATSLEKALL